MTHHAPFKLELTLFSAQELPPVSKMLRTFAVAYVHPDHKLTTRVDHQGHTNPKWNYKVVFHVDDKFLMQESSAVTIEIYNLAWLRDLPIGTARLNINNLSPPLDRNPGFRRVALRLCQPSGHLQGTLSLGLQLVENVVPGCEVSIFSTRSDDIMEEESRGEHGNPEPNNYIKEDDLKSHENSGASVTSKIENITPTIESTINNGTMPKPELEKKPSITPANSMYSVMRPLPSEVAEDMKKGLYTAEWHEYGSSVFENWTDQSDDRVVFKSDSMEWGPEDQIPLKNDKILGLSHKKRRSKKKNGLMSCFASVYGFRFSFICGSNALKKKKKKRNIKENVHLMTIPNADVHGFHV